MSKRMLLTIITATLITSPFIHAMRGQEEHNRKQEALVKQFSAEIVRKFKGGHGVTQFTTKKTENLIAIFKDGLDPKHIADSTSQDSVFHILVTHDDYAITPPFYPSKDSVIPSLGGNTALKLSQLKNDLGQTPLYLAADYGNSWVKPLVEARANINEPNKAGSTPVHKAAESNEKETLFYLIENGGDLTIKNKFDFTPYDTACRMGHFELAGALMEYALKNNINTFANVYTIPTRKQGK